MSTFTGPDVALALVIAVLVGGGVYLLMERSLSRVVIGAILVGNGINLLFLLTSGPPGGVPIVGMTEAADMADPLPQAMILTAIVITFALTAFLLAMAYRSWQINDHDEVQDDLEDRRIARMAAIDVRAASDDDDRDSVEVLDEEAATTRDEAYIEEHWLADEEGH